MIELFEWVATDWVPHTGSVLSIHEDTPPSPAADPQSSWWWQFSTGPALGGVLALAAAILAFVRLGHQVAEAKRGNDETARKNSEDQWWDTLKWTYAEAKQSKSENFTFRTVAAVRILDSLNQDHEKLTVQQQRAVRSILDIFGESEQSEVQEAVAPIYESFGQLSPYYYEFAVGDMLAQVAPKGVKLLHTSPNQRADFVLQSAHKTLAIEVKYANAPMGGRIIQHLLRVTPQGLGSASAVLLISPESLTPIAHQVLRNASMPASFVRWQPDESPKEVEGIVKQFFDEPER